MTLIYDKNSHTQLRMNKYIYKAPFPTDIYFTLKASLSSDGMSFRIETTNFLKIAVEDTLET